MKALTEKGEHLPVSGVERTGRSEHISNCQRELRLGQNLDDRIRGTTQRERIFGASWRGADAEHRGDGLNSISEAEQLPSRVSRN